MAPTARSCFHNGSEDDKNIMDISLWLYACTKSGVHRSEIDLSFVWKASRAVSGEERMMKVLRPILTEIMGPYFFASFAKVMCGMSTMLKRFPTIGSGVGPGGSLLSFFLVKLERKWRRISVRGINKSVNSIFDTNSVKDLRVEPCYECASGSLFIVGAF